MSQLHIPRPCAVGQQALTPTEAGWHCARCRTEVVDFTRLTEAEVLAYLAARAGQRVCAQVAGPVTPLRPARQPNGPRRWLLAALALLGVAPRLAQATLPPLPLALHKSLLFNSNSAARLVVRGTVVDDSLNVPVLGAYIFIQGTRFGAVTNERGEFSFSVAAGGPLVRHGQLVLEISANPFDFESKTVTVAAAAGRQPSPLRVRLQSRPDRGRIMGKIRVVKPPVVLPGAGRN